MQMAVTLRCQFGVVVGIGDIVVAPTAKLLAARLSGALSAQWSPLIEMRRNGDAYPSLFLLHPAGGQVFAYRGLLSQLVCVAGASFCKRSSWVKLVAPLLVAALLWQPLSRTCA